MTEKRRKTIVFAVLVIAALWGIWNNPLASKKHRGQEATTAGALPNDKPTATVAEEARAAAAVIGLDTWRDDPFPRRRAKISREVSSTEGNDRLAATAISKRGESYMAIVSGRVVREGDKIDGWTVTRIDAATVTLKKAEKTLNLTIERS